MWYQDKRSFHLQKIFCAISHKNYNDTQEILSIHENSQEPLVLMYEMAEDETLYSNQLKIEVKKGIKATLIEIVKSQKRTVPLFLIEKYP